MIYGYCSTASGKRELTKQRNRILEDYPDAVFLHEKHKINLEDPIFLLEHLRAVVTSQDMLVFDSIYRISTDADTCYRTYNILLNTGINLVFLKEPYLNTAIYQNVLSSIKESAIREQVIDAVYYILREQIKASLIYAEQSFLTQSRKRKDGIERARAEGKQIGQKTGATLHIKKKAAIKKGIQENAKDFGGTMTDAECMAHLRVSYHTYKKYKQELEEELRLKKN